MIKSLSTIQKHQSIKVKSTKSNIHLAELEAKAVSLVKKIQEQETDTVKWIDVPNEDSKLLISNSDLHYGETNQMSLAIGVWDDDKYRSINREELEFHLKTFVFEDTPEIWRPSFGHLVKRPV